LISQIENYLIAAIQYTIIEKTPATWQAYNAVTLEGRPSVQFLRVWMLIVWYWRKISNLYFWLQKGLPLI